MTARYPHVRNLALVLLAEACLRQVMGEGQAVARKGHFDFSLNLRDGSFEVGW